ncbi:hypothetical protein M9Y56_11160 [Pseudomonas juntendi]|uniref:hypothetical protein n=1 Tax=Pseudomonas juntendi TaxID=2666183 RepID=UPI000CE4FA67|nr:hypothetical protein [Pseudomonas juntendi]MBH3373903.1 hypothetical protein [Pseudomonas juntendi]MCL8329667.1 hypothetical protein [Pseudomonas juntendi]PPB14722.1 hypothetical protein HV87_08305 [Pseudomonas aeruginosa]
MTHIQQASEAVQGFIQSQVVVTIPGQQVFRLPPVVGVSLAGDIAAMVSADFPRAAVSILGRCRGSLVGLDDAMRVSEEVCAALEECRRQPHPGAALVEHFQAAAHAGGAQ